MKNQKLQNKLLELRLSCQKAINEVDILLDTSLKVDIKDGEENIITENMKRCWELQNNIISGIQSINRIVSVRHDIKTV